MPLNEKTGTYENLLNDWDRQESSNAIMDILRKFWSSWGFREMAYVSKKGYLLYSYVLYFTVV